MKIINKNILEISDGLICHACNCQNKFGKGLAKTIRDKFPQVYHEFLKFSSLYKFPKDRLGKIQEVSINKNLSVVNIFSQLYYGNSKETGIDYNNYPEMRKCFIQLKEIRNERRIYFPYGFGSGLAGGDWNKISGMIEEYFPDVVYCKI